MNPVALHFVSSYLLMPLLTIIFGVVAYFIARKNKLLNNKRLIVYLLLSGIVLALPGLAGFMNYNFMPYMYILLVVVYWIAGYYNRMVLRKVFSSSSNEQPSFGIQFLITVSVMLFGAGLFHWFSIFAMNCNMEYGHPPACFLFHFLYYMHRPLTAILRFLWKSIKSGSIQRSMIRILCISIVIRVL